MSTDIGDITAQLDELGRRALAGEHRALLDAVKLMVPTWQHDVFEIVGAAEAVLRAGGALLRVSIGPNRDMLSIALLFYFSDECPTDECNFMPWSVVGYQLGRMWARLPVTIREERAKATATLRLMGIEP